LLSIALCQGWPREFVPHELRSPGAKLATVRKGVCLGNSCFNAFNSRLNENCSLRRSQLSADRGRAGHDQRRRRGGCLKRPQPLPFPTGRKNEEPTRAKRCPFLWAVQRRADLHVIVNA